MSTYENISSFVSTSSISQFTGYAKAGKKLFEMALDAWDKYQDPYPIWGTCLGFELLALLAVNGSRNLAACWSQDQALPLNLTDQWSTSRIGQAMPEDMTQLVSTKPLTINFHRWCLTPENFTKFHMEDFWKMLATGQDLDGVGKYALCTNYKTFS